MNYYGERLVCIYENNPDTTAGTERPSAKWLYLYRDDDGIRPRMVAKFGDRFFPVTEGRDGSMYIVVGDRQPVVGDRQPQRSATCPRPLSVAAAVDEMVGKGKASKPALAGRLDSAAALVLGGKVTLEGEKATVGVYRVTADFCGCNDFQYRGGWCKHRLAVRIARHLATNGFEVPTEATAPRPIATVVTPLVSPENMALIASGRVIDDSLRAQAAYRNSEHGAQTAALRMMANGSKTLPADLARRAGAARPSAATKKGDRQ